MWLRRIIPVLALIICLWVPSPQSKRIISPSRFTSTAEGFLSGVGSDPAVPRKVTFSIFGLVLALRSKRHFFYHIILCITFSAQDLEEWAYAI
jgi:hypothetical protein